MTRYMHLAHWAAKLLATLAVVVVSSAPARPSFTVSGFTEPLLTIDVAAAEPGLLAALEIAEGDIVRRGQILAKLDVDVLEATRKMAQAAQDARGRIISAEAALALKRNRLQRLKDLQATGNANAEEVLVAETEVKLAEAELMTAREDRRIKKHDHDRIESQIQRRIVRSPIDGIVVRVHKDEAEYIPSSDPTVVTVVQCDKLRVHFPVPAAYSQWLAVDQHVTIDFPDQPSVPDAIVQYISPLIDPESGNVEVKVLLENKDGTYRSGTQCSMRLPSAPALTERIGTTPQRR